MTEGNDVRKGCEDVLVTPLWAKRKELRRKQGALRDRRGNREREARPS